MSHIAGETVAKLMAVLDSQAPDDAELHLNFGAKNSTPMVGYDNKPITLGDLRDMLRPFAMWF